MVLIHEHPCSLAPTFVSVIRVREFRARGSEPVICDLDLPFWHLNFDIWHFAFHLQPLTSFPFPIAAPNNFALWGTWPITGSEMAGCSPSMGTPLLQQITLMDNGVPQKFRKLRQ